MRPAALATALTFAAPLPAAANDFEPVHDRGRFLSIVEGQELRLGAFGVALWVAGDGSIRGSAMGADITGSWAWRDGYFCREMDWSGTPIPYNCQLVEVAAPGKVRFSVDRGAGRSAEFTLR